MGLANVSRILGYFSAAMTALLGLGVLGYTLFHPTAPGLAFGLFFLAFAGFILYRVRSQLG